jgi:hypothetical protein
MRREIFGEEHELFRAQFRRFAEKEIAPKVAGWNEAGRSDRETWRPTRPRNTAAPAAISCTRRS